MIYLVAPDPGSFTSGGNRFNQQILEGFSFLGYSCKRIDFSELDESITTGTNMIIFDSIYLSRINIIALYRIKAKKIFLIHLLPSMLGSQIDFANEQNVLAGFDLIIANSLFTRDYCLQTLNLSQSIAVIQPFIEKKQINRKEIKPYKFIHVSNWVPEKQIDLFLNELSKHALPADLSIYFYGDLHRSEDYFNHCNSILAAFPYLMKHIHLVGPLSHSQLQEEYADASLLIDTSSMETYGMAVAEAIANGVPVISLGNGNIRNLVNNNNGMVCKNMEELVISIPLYYQGDLKFDKMDASHIISDWTHFTDQLKLIIGE